MIEFECLVSELPRASRLTCTLFWTDGKKSKPVGGVCFQLFSYKGALNTGDRTVRLWPGPANPIGMCGGATSAHSGFEATLTFMNFDEGVRRDAGCVVPNAVQIFFDDDDFEVESDEDSEEGVACPRYHLLTIRRELPGAIRDRCAQGWRGPPCGSLTQ